MSGASSKADANSGSGMSSVGGSGVFQADDNALFPTPRRTRRNAARKERRILISLMTQVRIYLWRYSHIFGTFESQTNLCDYGRG
jgi:hypothetical protein